MTTQGSAVADGAHRAGTPADPQSKLDRLLAELRACVEQGGPARVDSTQQNLPRAQKLLAQVPLVHGMRETAHFHSALEGGALLSRAQLKQSPLPSEAYLRIKDAVYTCAGVLYPERRIALVFASTAEENAEVAASPWDTGSLCASRSICPDLPLAPAADRRALFDKTCLPAPHYRNYLVSYVASCFRAPEDYLDEKWHLYPDPAGVMSSGKRMARLFEVRFRTRLPIRNDTLLVAFVPKHARGRESLALGAALQKLRSLPAMIREYENEEHLVPAVRAWIRQHVDKETVR